MNNAEEFTGERYIPSCFSEHDHIALMHLERYNFASKYTKGKIILDIACGEGYGSFLFSKEGEKVFGVDIDDKTINLAKDKYKKDNLEFVVGGVNNIPIESESIDIVVSFETIEHVNSRAQRIFLREVDRVLKNGGIFIVSTPDKDVGGEGHNEFHIKELNKSGFFQMLNKYFCDIKFYGQDIKKYGNKSSLLIARFLHKLVKLDKYKIRHKLLPKKVRLRIDNESARMAVNKNIFRENIFTPEKLKDDETASFLVAVCGKK